MANEDFEAQVVRLAQLMGSETNDPDEMAEGIGIMVGMAGKLVADVSRIADAVGRVEVSGEPLEIQSFEGITDATAQRQANALERIADALEITNGASLAGLTMDPASPGGLRLGQALTEAIVAAVKRLDTQRKQRTLG